MCPNLQLHLHIPHQHPTAFNVTTLVSLVKAAKGSQSQKVSTAKELTVDTL